MKSLDLLENHDKLIFYTLEQNSFTLFPGISTIDIIAFFSKVSETKLLLISNDFNKSGHTEIPYQRTIYDSRFRLDGAENAWITYDLAIFLLSEKPEFMDSFEFLILDEIDDRQSRSDLFLGLILAKNQINANKTKIILPLKTKFKLEVYESYIKSFNYDVTSLDLITRPSISVYTVKASPKEHLVNSQILETINQFLKKNNDTDEFYDILVILNTEPKCKKFINYLKDHSVFTTYSIITNIQDYQIKGSNRRLIIHTGSSEFLHLNHRIKLIIDVGIINVRIEDVNLLPIMITKPTTKNHIESHLSILSKAGSSYFCFGNIKHFNDFEYDSLNRYFIPHLLYILKNKVTLNNLKLLKSPAQEILQRSISYLVFLGFVTVIGSEVLLTDLGQLLMEFQLELNLRSFNLFSLLINSIEFRCTKEMLKLLSILIILDWNKLSIYFKEKKVQPITVQGNDFLTLINIYNSIIDYDKVKPHHLTMTFNEFFDKNDKMRIFETFKKLRSILNKPVNFEDADEDSINKTLFKSYQLHSGLLEISHSSHKAELSISPVIPFESSSLNIFMGKQSTEDYEKDSINNIIIFSDCEYQLLYYEIKKSINTNTLMSDDLNFDSRDDNNNIAYTNFTAKIPKRIVKDVNSPIFKFT